MKHAALDARLARIERQVWRLLNRPQPWTQGTLAAWLAMQLDSDEQLPEAAGDVIAALEPPFLEAAVLIAAAERRATR